MKRYALVLLVPSLLAACGGGGGSSPPPPTTGSLQFTNSSSYSVDQVFLVPATSPSWGSQQNGSPIPSGGTFLLTGIPPSTYDGRAVIIGAASTYYADALGFPVAAGQTYFLTAFNSSFTGTVTVTNGNVTFSITEVYLVPSGSPTWGTNQLTSSIPPLVSQQIQGVAAGTWDLRCVHSDGFVQDILGFAVGSVSISPVSCN